MAYEIPSFFIGVLQANINFTTESSYMFVGVDVGSATGTGLSGSALIAPASSGAAILGVLQNNPQLGEAGAVMVHGVSKMQAGGTITPGQLITINASGQAVVAVSGNYACGKALENGANGSLVTVLLFGYGKQ